MNEPIAGVVERLVARHGSAAHVARIIGGISARAVLRHASGERAPSSEIATKYAELDASSSAVTPPPGAYVATVDTRDEETPVLTPPSTLRAAAGPTREHLEALLAKAELALEKTLDDDNAAPRDRSAAIMAVKNVLRDLARLRGELEITEPMVLRSRAGRHVLDVVLLALKPYPDALGAVAKELERLAAGEA